MALEYTVAYWDEPQNVIWIDLPHRRLQGMDNYWIRGHRYGMFNDPENYDMYEGKQAVAWRYIRGVETELEDPTPLENAQVFAGYMLTTEQAEFVGLL